MEELFWNAKQGGRANRQAAVGGDDPSAFDFGRSVPDEEIRGVRAHGGDRAKEGWH